MIELLESKERYVRNASTEAFADSINMIVGDALTVTISLPRLTTRPAG
jgi:hypothetical protein